MSMSLMNNFFLYTLVVLLYLPAHSQFHVQYQKINSWHRDAGDKFGVGDVMIHGNQTFVGTPSETTDTNNTNAISQSGAVFVFNESASGRWQQGQKLIASDRGTIEDRFGSAFDISGSTMVVSAVGEDEDTSGLTTLSFAGATYIFEKNGSGMWIEKQKIVASDRAVNDYFGTDVCVDGNYMIVGASGDDEDSLGGNYVKDAGSAYVFQKNGSNKWVQTQKISAWHRSIEDRLGSAMDMDGNILVCGMPQDFEDSVGLNSLNYAGSVAVFERNASGKYVQVQKLNNSDRALADFFGYAIAVDGNLMAVSALWEDEDSSGNNTKDYAGSVYLFERNGSGHWDEIAKLTPADRTSDDYFGSALALDGDHLVVASYTNSKDENGLPSASEAGAIYHFKRDGNGNWQEVQKLVASDYAASDKLGRSVDVSGDKIVVNCPYQELDSVGSNSLVDAGATYFFYDCPAYYDTVAVLACKEFMYPGDTILHVTSGFYDMLFTSAKGCDSIITLDLTILPEFYFIQNITSCDSYTPSGSSTSYTVSGTYIDTLTSRFGCDSVIHLNLKINYSDDTTIVVDACENYRSPSGKYLYEETGIYYDTLSTKKGCDSIVVIDLNISTVDASVTQTGNKLTANMPGATYQWVLCNNNAVPIGGENKQTFTALNNGFYAVIVSYESCSDTSHCYQVGGIGIKDDEQTTLMVVAPNPTAGLFTVDFGRIMNEGRINVWNTNGNLVMSKLIQNIARTEIELNGPVGMYFVEIVSETGTREILKLLKK